MPCELDTHKQDKLKGNTSKNKDNGYVGHNWLNPGHHFESVLIPLFRINKRTNPKD